MTIPDIDRKLAKLEKVHEDEAGCRVKYLRTVLKELRKTKLAIEELRHQ